MAELFNEMKERVRPSNDNLARYYLKERNTGKRIVGKRIQGEVDSLKEKT